MQLVIDNSRSFGTILGLSVVVYDEIVESIQKEDKYVFLEKNKKYKKIIIGCI